MVKKSVVKQKGEKTYATWCNESGQETDSYSFQQLWDEAGVISHYLRNEWSLNKGDHVVLCYNFGLHFFAAFLGCLRAGVVAVLVYPPNPPLTKSLPKMAAVVTDCNSKVVLCDANVSLLRILDRANPLSKSRHLWPTNCEFKATSLLFTKEGKKNNTWSSLSAVFRLFPQENAKKYTIPVFDEESLANDDVAFLQYTSGSTGAPKGVVIKFAALRANVELIHHGLKASGATSAASGNNFSVFS